MLECFIFGVTIRIKPRANVKNGSCGGNNICFTTYYAAICK